MNHKSGGIGSGFIFGLIIGVVGTLLFTTKKGRQVLRILSEEGLDKVKKWESVLDEIELDDDLEEEGDYIPENEKKPTEKKVLLARVNGSKLTSRRFFRGSSRK